MHEFNYATQSSAPGQVVALEAVRTPDVFIYVELTATESLLSLVVSMLGKTCGEATGKALSIEVQTALIKVAHIWFKKFLWPLNVCRCVYSKKFLENFDLLSKYNWCLVHPVNYYRENSIVMSF